MIVSWDWLQEYVDLDRSVEEITDRLTMTGLNLEGIEPAGNDTAIDLEVTSNRPDCLGHIGVAREIAVAFGKSLRIPEAVVEESGEQCADATSVEIECPDLCPQYHARIVRGVKIGPSPDWLVKRLDAVGIGSVNNVVDVTNYVMLECGQPLHAFDFDKLHGGRIVVRRGRPGEKLTAIDHEEYAVDEETCVIADADRAVAIAGVMGGFDTEIADDTTSVLIEVADFAPLTVRNTARRLKLFSPSSYRFERGVDQSKLDWASRRCCELILEVAGGELLAGSAVAGTVEQPAREPVPIRFAKVDRLLGIHVPREHAVGLLEKLGCQLVESDGDYDLFTPPTWRRDLTREVDLIEEVARMNGYDLIPVDAEIPLSLSSKTHRDRVRERVESTLVAAGFHESLTLSFVKPAQVARFDPLGIGESVARTPHSTRGEEDVLRPSLVPSLLECLRDNERQGSFGVRLFEIAKVFLAADPERPERETQPLHVGLACSMPFADLKGVVEAVVRDVAGVVTLSARPSDLASFTEGRGAELFIGEARLGWLGELSRDVTDPLKLRDSITVAELDFGVLEDVARLVPHARELPFFPAIDRDLNFVLDETVAWSDLAATVRSAAGPLLESVGFGGQYRGKQIAVDKKSYVVQLAYRAPDRTLTGEEVDAAQQQVITACGEQLGAELR